MSFLDPVSSIPSAPRARPREHVDVLHGEAVADPFRWLEDFSDPDVRAWTDAQDLWARSHCARFPERAALARRLEQLLDVDDVAPPAQRGDRVFFVRHRRGEQKAVVWWKGPDGVERVALDPNAWSAENTTSLGVWVPSPDGKWIVFQKRPHAADEAELHLLEVDTGRWSIRDRIAGAQHTQPSWLPDGSGFFYEQQPIDRSIAPTERIARAVTKFHRVGTSPSDDALIYPATGNASHFLSSWHSSDDTCLVINIWRSWSENDVFVRPHGETGFRELIRGKGARYIVNAWAGELYITTDEGAPRQRLFKTPITRLARADWKEIVPERPDAVLENVSIVGGRLALRYSRAAVTELALLSLDGVHEREVPLPRPCVASDLYGLETSDEAYVAFSALHQPPAIVRMRVSSGETALWHRTPIEIDTSSWVLEQREYSSKDGARVPLFLARHKDRALDGDTPTILYGYGGFNLNVSPTFAGTIAAWIERGGAYAIANIRGGGELGSEWHEQGTRHRKQTVFDDFLAAAEALIAWRITRSGRLAINGSSNGGLLVTAAMTQRPDLFGAVVCGVPLTDMLRYHRVGVGSLWVPELGSADDPDDFAVLRRYSPYHRVEKGRRYPPLFMHSAEHDDRVDPMHARKFVAAIQDAHLENEALLRVERDAGHFGADQTRRLIESRADQYAWLWEKIGR